MRVAATCSLTGIPQHITTKGADRTTGIERLANDAATMEGADRSRATSSRGAVVLSIVPSRATGGGDEPTEDSGVLRARES